MKYIKTYTIKSITCVYIHVHTCIHVYMYVCLFVLLALPYILHIPSDTLALVKFFLPTCYWYGSEHLLLYLGFFSVSICNGQKFA